MFECIRDVEAVHFHAASATTALAASLDTLDQIERTSVDHYATIRNLYRQIRSNEIANGKRDFDDLPDIENLNFDTNEPESPSLQF